MQFFKMQNQGNDYIFLFERPTKQQVIALCDRNFGVGGDGVVYIYNKDGTYGYEIYNKDGSKATFCGSVTLALGLYIYKKEGKNKFSIITDSGKKKIEVVKTGERIKVCLWVDKPRFFIKEKLFNRLIFLKSENKILRIRATFVDVGNKHLVVRGLYNEEMRKRIVCAIKENHFFAGGINVEFVERLSSSRARVIVYERGSGKTLCCSSGACAVFATLNKLGHFSNRAELNFDGGKMLAEKQGKRIKISSYPKFVYFGNRCEL